MRIAGVAGDRGDTAAVDAAVREYRSHGGHVGVVGLPTLWLGGTKLRAEIASMTADMLGASSAQDSIEYYVTRGYVYEAAVEQTKLKAAADSGLAIVRRLLATRRQDPNVARGLDPKLAGFLAVQGDQQGALAALQRFRNPPELAKYPDGAVGAQVACFSYVIYAKLALVDRVIPELQRCISLPGGRSREAIPRIADNDSVLGGSACSGGSSVGSQRASQSYRPTVPSSDGPPARARAFAGLAPRHPEARRSDRAQRRGRFGEAPHERRLRRARRERRLAAEHVIEDAAERVHVAARIG